MLVRAIIEYDAETQAFSATCPELNFVSSCGVTKEDAISNLQEAIALMFEPIPEQYLPKHQATHHYEQLEFVI